MNSVRPSRALVVTTLVALAACASTPSTTSDPDAGSTVGDGGATACFSAWGQVTKLYANATHLKSCDGVAGAKTIVESLMNLDGLTIDNNGKSETPCIDTRCDDTYVYVASNSIPHYDFVATTPNALVEVPSIYRIPMVPHVVDGAGVTSTNATSIHGCTTAYATYLSSPTSGTSSEPSGFCGATGYFYDELGDGSKDYYRKAPCLGTDGFTISGPPVFGPNEGPTPDPWGNPGYNWPTAGGEIGPIQGATLDLCGGHTANVMHYHGANEACFARDADRKPKTSYVTAASAWDFKAALDGDCTVESGIVGWSLDGYPIKGSCVCTERNGDGSCKTVRRARSSWMYDGLSSWGTGTEASFAKEGVSCSVSSDCCTGATCRYVCSWGVFSDSSAPGGSVADKRCVLRDYTWCANRFSDHSETDVSSANFVYMDRCNGFDGPDGYAYYATASFPFLMGCYHGVPSDSSGGGSLSQTMTMGMGMGDGGMMPPRDGGMMMPPPGDGGMGMIPMCAPGQTRCCGDGTCDGPELPQNCPADCH